MDENGDLISEKGERTDYGILRRDKDYLRLLTQLVTGHGNIGYHRYLMNIENSPNCDCGEVQTAVHLITECPILIGYRIQILGRPLINEEDIRSYSFYKILRLVRQTDFWNHKTIWLQRSFCLIII